MNEKHLLHHFSFKGFCGRSMSRVTFDCLNHKKKTSYDPQFPVEFMTQTPVSAVNKVGVLEANLMNFTSLILSDSLNNIQVCNK